MISFALVVKEEIAKKTFDLCCEHYLLAGFIKNNAEITLSNSKVSFTISSISNAVIRRIYQTMRQLFPGIQLELAVHQSQKLKYNRLFVLRVKHEGLSILEKLGLKNWLNTNQIYESLRMQKECCQRAFTAGSFIACGSVNSPLTSNYHLELQFDNTDNAQHFRKFINHFHFGFKSIGRKNKYVCYIKQASAISDFIKFIDASNAMLEFENARIKRDFKNNINRLNNIDISNQQKSMHAGEEQRMMIAYLQDHKGFAELSEKAQKIAVLRLENADAPFVELAELMADVYDIEISKSGINHLFREIKQRYAMEFAQNKDDEYVCTKSNEYS